MRLFAAFAAAQVQAPQLPDWMAGCWEATAGARITVECWSMPAGAAMVGESVTRVSGKVTEREQMRIVHAETDDAAIPWMTFEASPSTGKPTRFDWVSSAEPGLTFMNRAHDYPQRVRYWRDGRFLMAEIAGADGSKPRRWRYTPRGR